MTKLSPPNQWTRERILEMYVLFKDNKSFRDIGGLYGISHERVRQLFIQEGLPTRREVKLQTLLKEERKEEAQERREEIVEHYKQLGNAAETAKAVGLPYARVKEIIDEEIGIRSLYQRTGGERQYTDQQLIEALQYAVQYCGEPLSVPCYARLAPTSGLPAPRTFFKAFDSWQAACEAAGIEHNPALGTYEGSYTCEDCVAALLMYYEREKQIPSYATYTIWAKESGAPSGPTVRAKCITWRNALRLAFEDE